jgi:hypothetical protein
LNFSKSLPLAQNALEFLQQESVNKAAGLEILRQAGDSVIGLEFSGSDRVITDVSEIESYIETSAHEFVFGSVRNEVTTFLRGVYDTVPFGYFSWFTRKELVIVVGGQDSPVDREQLLSSITLTVNEKGVSTEDGTEVVKMLKQAISKISGGDVGKFLKFVSGADRAPLPKWLTMRFMPNWPVD